MKVMAAARGTGQEPDLTTFRQKLEAMISGTDIDTPYGGNQTALQMASTEGWAGCAKELLNRGANPNRATSAVRVPEAPLHLACHNDHIEVVQELISSNADVNKVFTGGLRCKDFTPLHFAVRFQGGPELVKLLLQNGVSPPAPIASPLILLCRALTPPPPNTQVPIRC